MECIGQTVGLNVISLKMIELVVYLQRCVQASLLEGQQAADVTFKPVVLQLMCYFYTAVDGRSKLVVPEKYCTRLMCDVCIP